MEGCMTHHPAWELQFGQFRLEFILIWVLVGTINFLIVQDYLFCIGFSYAANPLHFLFPAYFMAR